MDISSAPVLGAWHNRTAEEFRFASGKKQDVSWPTASIRGYRAGAATGVEWGRITGQGSRLGKSRGVGERSERLDAVGMRVTRTPLTPTRARSQ